MSQACQHQWRNRCSAHPHTCPSHCDQMVQLIIFFFTTIINVVMNIKLHMLVHKLVLRVNKMTKGSSDVRDDDDHLELLRGFPIVFVLIISSINITTMMMMMMMMTTTLRWFEDVQACPSFAFQMCWLPESASACSELKSCYSS